MTDFAGLTDVPDAWLTEAFLTDLRRSAALQAATSAADTLLADARRDRDRAAEGMASGVNLPASMAVLLRASMAVLAAEGARSAIPSVVSDPIHAQAPLEAARAALAVVSGSLKLTVLASDTRMASWRLNLKRVGARAGEPPVVTDADREVAPVLADMVARVGRWNADVRTWHESLKQPGVNPVDLLASAAGMIAAAEPLLRVAMQVNALVSQANAGRPLQLAGLGV